MTAATQKLDSIRMRSDETMAEFDERFSSIVNELVSLGKIYSNREISIKAMRALPREWDIKTVAMKEIKDLNKLELHDLFVDLKAYEFEKNSRKEEEQSSSTSTKALVTAEEPRASTADQTSAKTADQISSNQMASFVEMIGNFMSHFTTDCRKPKRDNKK